MKKVLSYILISLIIFVNLFAPFSVGMSGKKIEIKKNEVKAASNCKVTSATFSPDTKITDNRPPTIDYTIYTSGCVSVPNIVISTTVAIMHSTPTPNTEVLTIPQEGPNGGPFTSDTVTGTIITGEYDCKNGTCDLRYIFKVLEKGTIISENHDYDRDTGFGFTCLGKSGCSNLGWDYITETGAWFFSTTTPDGAVTKNLSYVDEATCNTKRDSWVKTMPSFKLGVCQQKVQAQTTNVDVYYYDILTDGAQLDQSANYSGPTAKADCEASKKAFDDSITQQGKANVNTSECKTKIIKQVTSGSNTGTNGGGSGGSGQTMPACGIIPGPLSNGTLSGCIAQGAYYLLFVPTSYLFALSGIFFDNTFAYSVNDQSYKSAFVVQGWGLIRDFCNMLFIFIMLYVAIGTTLSLNSMKTKETIVNVVIIGLFINFSLFATQVIIDASNITARVFYNSNAIKITEKGVDGAATLATKPGDGGVIPLSSGLVNKVNPQNLILRAGEINNVKTNTAAGLNNVQTSSGSDIGPGQFILIVLMASGVNVVGFTVFLTVGFLFIARVIGLWLAMILSPLAFFTYILPEMAGTKMIGWKNWWPETLKMAFLAPVFIFFMYIILKFLETDLISDASSKTGLAFFASALIPFAFIMILMVKAKKIATDMSGEFGEMVTKAGSAVGGLALGAATGGAALAMRGTIGRAGSAIANNDAIQQAAAKKGLVGMGARLLFSGGKKVGSASFDARNTKAGALAGSKLGVDMGKAKEGGFVKARAEKTAKRQQRAKDLELSVDSTQKKDLMKKQMQQKGMEDKFSVPIHDIDGQLTAAKLLKSEAVTGSQDDIDATKKIQELNNQKAAYTKGGAIRDAAGNITGYNTTNGLITKTELDDDVTNKNKKVNNDEATALASGTVAGDAINNIATVATTAGAAKIAAEQKAATDETAAIAAAGAAKIAAEQKAATDETNAIQQASTIAANMTNIAKDAREKATANPNDGALVQAADDAELATKNANTKLQNITTQAGAAKIAAEQKAATDETAAIAAAGAAKIAAEQKAATDETNAINEAEAAKDEAIAKATSDEATATTSRTAANTATTNRDTLVNSGQIGKSINELKFGDIPHAELAINKRNNAVKGDFAEYLGSGANKVANFITSGGVHDFNGDFEAMYKIKMDAKIENSGGGQGGGVSHSAPAHAPTAPATPATPAGGGNNAGGGNAAAATHN